MRGRGSKGGERRHGARRLEDAVPEPHSEASQLPRRGMAWHGVAWRAVQGRAREGRALIMPHSAVLDIPDPAAAAARSRPLFLFYRGSCPKLTEARVLRVNTAGKLLRRALVVGLNDTAPDIEVGPRAWLPGADASARGRVQHWRLPSC